MKTLALGIVMTGVLTTSAAAQTVNARFDTAALRRAAAEAFTVARVEAARQTPAAAPAPAPVTVLVGVDFPSVYFFRGILQEGDPALTAQPFVDVGIPVGSTTTINVGTWNSFHTGSNKDALGGAWYESDLYASVTMVAGKWKPGALFTLYTSPAGGYEGLDSVGVAELAFFASYDDSAMSVPISPKVLVAVELTDTQADFGNHKGIYLEVSGKPTFKAGTATIGVPVKLGMSMKDYFETFTGAGGASEDNKFGFFQAGGSVSVPLPVGGAGSWEVHGGVDVLVFGEHRKVMMAGDNEPKAFKPVASVGLSVGF